MKTLEYRTRDKSGWPPGPWQDEPDKKQWLDEATGLPCLIVRNRCGALCGYVGVPKTHGLHGIRGGEIVDRLDVHGGITFSDFCHEAGDECESICHKVEPGEDDKVWWLGFDTAHGGDLVPAAGYPSRVQELLTYRDLAYVEGECRNLAKQLAAL
jgi:hypothetical protein